MATTTNYNFPLIAGTETADLEIYPTSGTLSNIVVMLKAFFY